MKDSLKNLDVQYHWVDTAYAMYPRDEAFIKVWENADHADDVNDKFDFDVTVKSRQAVKDVIDYLETELVGLKASESVQDYVTGLENDEECTYRHKIRRPERWGSSCLSLGHGFWGEWLDQAGVRSSTFCVELFTKEEVTPEKLAVLDAGNVWHKVAHWIDEEITVCYSYRGKNDIIRDIHESLQKLYPHLDKEYVCYAKGYNGHSGRNQCLRQKARRIENKYDVALQHLTARPRVRITQPKTYYLNCATPLNPQAFVDSCREEQDAA
jgi:hypothetical protein